MSGICTKLLLVRHGDYYNHNQRLNVNGVEQITSIASKLAQIVRDQRIQIISSTAKRASESADIIAKTLNCNYEQNEIFWSEDKHPEDFVSALNIIKSYSDTTDAIIIVTHFEYMAWFPRYFAREYLGKHIESYAIDKGSMWVLDWTNIENITLDEVRPY